MLLAVAVLLPETVWLFPTAHLYAFALALLPVMLRPPGALIVSPPPAVNVSGALAIAVLFPPSVLPSPPSAR